MSTPLDTADRQALLKRALLEIKDLRAKLEKLEKLDRARVEPIAIIGMGCRFPGGADDPEALWRLLHEGAEVSSEVPKDRWDVDAHYDPDPNAPMKTYSRRGSFIDRIEHFDPQFFGMSPREAISMDPQQRVFLEVCWEALEHAGQAPDKLAGSKTGVFAASGNEEYAYRLEKAGHTDAHTATGNIPGFMPGRISFLLGLNGPSISLHTTCSSSLVAIHLACQSLRMKECDMALAGGGSLMLSPFGHIALCKIGMMAKDGRSKTFDASGDGYGRGEGMGVIIIKRLSDALENGDRIHALIRGSAVNQDGSSSGVAVPNGAAQQALLREALANARVEPAQVSYIEAHGTGTPVGDPIEVRAIGAVFGKGRPKDQPLVLGALKANIGHLELGAGVASVIKTALALEHQEIPPQPSSLRQRNPMIPWDEFPLLVPMKPLPWPSGKGARIAGVNSLGGSGTNAHLILEEAPPLPPSSAEAGLRPVHLLALSAKSEAALAALVARYEAYLSAHPAVSLADVCFTAGAGRSHFKHRRAMVVRSVEEAREKLAAAPASPGVLCGEAIRSKRPKVAFLLSSAAEPSITLARQLYTTQPSFRKTLDEMSALLEPHRLPAFSTVLLPDAGAEPIDPAFAEPLLFGLSYALAELVRAWGIEPSAVLGEGTGEYVAACLSRVFSVEAGLRLAVARGRLRAVRSAPGASPSAVASALDELEKAANQITHASPSLRLITSVTGQAASGKSLLSPGYWRCQAEEPARMAAARKALAEVGCDVAVEVSFGEPRAEGDSAMTWLPAVRAGQDAWQSLLTTLGALYVRGASVDFARLDRDYPRRRLALPTYPFERERYILDLAPGSHVAAAPAVHIGLTEVQAAPTGLTFATLRASSDQARLLKDYLCQHIARALMLPSAKLDTQESLKDLGLNSLMYAELKGAIEADLGLSLSLKELLQGPSVVEVTEKLLVALAAEAPQEGAVAPAANGTAATRDASPAATLDAATPRSPLSSPAVSDDAKRWLILRTPNPQAKVRLFCFPYGGGGASIFRTWSELLPKEVEIWSAQLPGREERISEAPLRDLASITKALLEAIKPHLDRPFAFYGHSMGALLSYELARALHAQGAPSPRLLVVAGCRAPHLVKPLWSRSDGEFSDADVIETLRRLDSPASFLESDALKQILLPTVRADLEAVNAYTATADRPLTSRIVALVGAHDQMISRAQADAWREHTRGSFDLTELPGGHLFMDTHRDLLLKRLSHELIEILRETPHQSSERTTLT